MAASKKTVLEIVSKDLSSQKGDASIQAILKLIGSTSDGKKLKEEGKNSKKVNAKIVEDFVESVSEEKKKGKKSRTSFSKSLSEDAEKGDSLLKTRHKSSGLNSSSPEKTQDISDLIDASKDTSSALNVLGQNVNAVNQQLNNQTSVYTRVIGFYNAMANAAARAAAALGGGAGAGGGGGTGGGGGGGGTPAPAGGGGGGLLAAAGKLGLAYITAKSIVKAFTTALGDAGDVVTNFSGAVARAQAEQDVQRVQDQIKIAQESGSQFAGLIQQQTEMQTAFRNLKADFIKLMAPFFEFVMLAFTVIMKILNIIVSIIQFIYDTIKAGFDAILAAIEWLFTYVPIIADQVTKIRKWLNAQDDPANASMQKDIDDLFNSVAGQTRPFNPKNPNAGNPRL
jgi:hypothetical protein